MKNCAFRSVQYRALPWLSRNLPVQPWVVCRNFSAQTRAASEENYFHTLGMAPSFPVDEEELKSAYLKLMSHLHPDRNHHLSKDEQENLEQKASAVTRAYDTLKRPHLRAVHLLKLHGQPMEETATGKLVGDEFLMEIMEIRDSVEQTNDDHELKMLLERNRQRLQATYDELSEAFDQDDLERATMLTARLQYFHRIEETIRGKSNSSD